jgi:putative transposase
VPQSLACVHLHIVFSTKHRKPCLVESVRTELHAYMATVLQNLACPALIINSVEDHVHILLELSRTVSTSTAVERVKKASSKWLKTQAPELAAFSWQVGYGVFAVSKWDLTRVYQYI